MRLQPWQLTVGLVALCAAGIAFAFWRSDRHYDAASMIACLPPDQASHLYINISALRDAGILDLVAGSKADEEPDYKRFVEQTGFDYRSDLEAVAAAFFHGGSYFVVRGRFEWQKLIAYARAQHGDCINAVCFMPASDQKRFISFSPLASNVLAMAVSTEERGVNMIAPNQWKKPPATPADPVWFSAPAFAFSDPKDLPAGAQAFLRPLSQAEHIVLSVGGNGNAWQIRLEASCADAASASALGEKLTTTTDLLKKMLEREKMTPNPRDLSGVLVAGTFKSEDKRVVGGWPVERGFLETLVTGKLQ